MTRTDFRKICNSARKNGQGTYKAGTKEEIVIYQFKKRLGHEYSLRSGGQTVDVADAPEKFDYIID